MMCIKTIKNLLPISLFFLMTINLSGQGFLSYFSSESKIMLPENTEVRQSSAELITGPPVDWTGVDSRSIPQRNASGSVRISSTMTADSLELHFINELPGAEDNYSPGSYHFIASSDAQWNSIRIDLAMSDDSFLILSRDVFDAGRIDLSVTLFGMERFKSAKLPISLEQAAVASFAELQKLSQFQLPWDLLLPDPDHPGYRNTRLFAAEIAGDLAYLTDGDDGAFDTDGRPVLIRNEEYNDQAGLNCSGFAKWVVDSIYRQATGRGTDIAVLKAKPLELRGTPWSEPQEDARDPYFGLDWTRNLAVEIKKLTYPDASYEDMDVNSVPWLRYIEDIGYNVTSLPTLLYYEAVRNPGSFYLGSISKEFGEDPVLRQHTHVAVLFPWLDRQGQLQIRIMERNVETDPDLFIDRNSAFDIHLVRVEAPEKVMLEYLQESLKR